jgi:hypothetical protein
MDAASRQRRIGRLSVIAALVVVCAFWTFYVPRSTLYKNYSQERKLKETLQAIKPPPGTQGGNVTTSHTGDAVLAMGIYFSNLHPEPLKSYYVDEFARHGFVYKGEVTSPDSQKSVKFCAPGYVATLSLPKQDMSLPLYTIVLYPSGAAC